MLRKSVVILTSRIHTTLFCFRMEYLFNFDDKFEIHDDIEVLKRMGMVLGE
jgi:hypothetical protein